MNWKPISIAAAAVLAFGAIRAPIEDRLTGEFRQAHFFQSQLTLNLRRQTTQMLFVAALGGLRAAVADYLWIQNYEAFVDTNWGRMKVLMDATCALQPRAVMFWENASWHMAWNASIAAEKNRDQLREALRMKASREYIALGEDYLLRGLEYNWDSAKLYEALGDLYSRRMNDPCRAAWAYFEGAKRSNTMGFTYRFGVYALAKCPGHEEETLRLLRELYHQGPSQRTPTALVLLRDFQEKLKVPAAERIDITKDLEEATPGRRKQPPAK
jgi:hypothetical protein